MRARLRSYGDTSTRTRSPGRMRMRKRRILPATCPSTSWPLSSCTRNIAFGSASTTSPSNSTFSSFAKLDDPDVRGLRALGGLAELVLDLRAFRKRAETVTCDAREVDERVLAPVVGGDEPEALLVAEPLHHTGGHCKHSSLEPRGVIPPSARLARRLGGAVGNRGVRRGLRRGLVLLGVEPVAVPIAVAVAVPVPLAGSARAAGGLVRARRRLDGSRGLDRRRSGG